MTSPSTSQSLDGVQFPPDKAGKRSTTNIGKQIVAAALEKVDPSLAERVLAEKNWRKNYRQYFVRMTELGLESAENAFSIAHNGLDAAYDQFEFIRDGQTTSLRQAMQQYTTPYYHTAIVAGNGTKRPFTVPYKRKRLSGNPLRTQLHEWQERGIIEPSYRAAIERVIDNPAWLDNPEHAFVLMGANAEIGPYRVLLNLGATVVAVDLNRPEIWERLITAARDSAGTLIFPIPVEQSERFSDTQLANLAGANLITHAPEVATWLNDLDRPMTLGGYAYLDSGDFVRVSMAMDAIISTVSTHKPDSSLAFLLTPTDVMGIPQAAADEAQERHKKAGAGSKLLQSLSGSRWFAPNATRVITSREGRRYGVVNSLITQQGPNYTLAKRIQRWRSVVAREQGHVVSCNVAPATYTHSVTQNKIFMAGYQGAEYFGVEIFRPSTTNTLMTAMLIHDLYFDEAASHPEVELDNPEELFMEGANHGGMWRMPSQLSSMLEPGVVVGYLRGIFGRKSD